MIATIENRKASSRSRTTRRPSLRSASVTDPAYSLYELPPEMDELLVQSEFNPLGLGVDVHTALADETR